MLTLEQENALAQEYLWIVAAVVRRFAKSSADSVHDDLYSAGQCGLLCAMRSHDPARGGTLRGYMFRVIKHAVQKELKQIARHRRVISLYEGLMVDDEVADDSALLRDERESPPPDRLDRYLRNLTMAERQAVELCLLEGNSQRETARKLNRNDKTIQRNIAKALEKMILTARIDRDAAMYAAHRGNKVRARFIIQRHSTDETPFETNDPQQALEFVREAEIAPLPASRASSVEYRSMPSWIVAGKACIFDRETRQKITAAELEEMVA